ncbi:MAG TPA: SDR family NAD(P)-dependent oxidoreductase [Methylomirabilota bacterium]|nr:SDR family NAD(P)-dependent oxidoreductase [Methylomirabilota bacterium]
MDFSGKVALVTGAGSGIGKASALKLAAAGAIVGALGRTEEEVRQTCAEIRGAGGVSIALVADIAEEDQMRAAVDKLVAAHGRLDIVFANAGINGVWAPIEELKPEEFDRTVSINLRGTYLTIHLTVPHLKAAGGGVILVTSSINGTRTFTSPGATAYSATKAAQVAMVQMLAVELGPDRIRVNAICPGRIGTEIDDNTERRNSEEAGYPAEFPEGDIPLTGHRGGAAEDVADLVVFLASDAARHITGSPVWIDGAQSLVR